MSLNLSINVDKGNCFLKADVNYDLPNTDIDLYLSTPFTGNLTILDSMPNVKNVFIKYNTILPSSSSVFY